MGDYVEMWRSDQWEPLSRAQLMTQICSMQAENVRLKKDIYVKLKAANAALKAELKGISGALVDAGDIELPAGITGLEDAVREVVRQRDELRARIAGGENDE